MHAWKFEEFIALGVPGLDASTVCLQPKRKSHVRFLKIGLSLSLYLLQKRKKTSCSNGKDEIWTMDTLKDQMKLSCGQGTLERQINYCMNKNYKFE